MSKNENSGGVEVLDAFSRARDALADEQHAIWSHWMSYMFTCGVMMRDGSWAMPPALVKRWKRQMRSEFGELTPEERKGDYEMADRVTNALLRNSLTIRAQKEER